MISGPRYFLPSYSGTGVSLVVTTATMTVAPSSGPAGTVVTLNGASYPPGDPVTITGFSGTAYVGLAVCTHNGFSVPAPGGPELAAAKFDNLTVTK